MPAIDCLEVERAVLGACIGKPKVFFEYAAVLRAEHFSLSFHRKVFEALTELNGGVGDPLAIAVAVGGQCLADVLELQFGAAWCFQKTHCETLLDRFRRRELVTACRIAIAQSEDLSEGTADAFGALEERLLAVRAAERLGSRPIAHIAVEALNELSTIRDRGDGLIGLTTSIPDLDTATTGIRDGELWVIGGRPGHGKTALAAQIAFANAKNGVPAEIFSVEMKDRQLFLRALAEESGVDTSKIRHPASINASEMRQLVSAAQCLGNLPIYIDDSDSLHISELIARATLAVRKRKARLIVVDYLQILDGPGEDEKLIVGRIANRLRAFAKREQVCVLALSQLLKSKDPNDKPTMGALRETGRIEDACHVGILAFQPVDSDYHKTGEDELIIGKNREGMTGSIPVTFRKQSLTYKPRFRSASHS